MVANSISVCVWCLLIIEFDVCFVLEANHLRRQTRPNSILAL